MKMNERSLYYLSRINPVTKENEIIPLRGNEVVVGRKDLASVHISRNHATFRMHGERWTITYIGQNGLFLDGRSLMRDVEYPLSLECEIQFGQQDVFTYKFRVKKVERGRGSVNVSRVRSKKLRPDSGSSNVDGDIMNQEYMEVEQQLKGSLEIQMRLKEERDQMRQTLQEQQVKLQEKYQQEKAELEQQFHNGSLAQQAMLDEKEVLAQRLKTEVSCLQNQLDEGRKFLEERLKQEEERNRVLQEKENELRRLAEEKARLEKEQEQERQRLHQQLLDTETHKEELRQQVEAKDWAIRAKEAEHQQAEEEKQRLQDQLAQERIGREQEKHKLEEELMLSKAQDQIILQEALQALENEKKNLMQELASSAMQSSEAKKEVVETVSDVLEDELQCSICNELFISAVVLNCSHTFCRHCIDRWKKNKRECPNCRLPITSESRSLVVDNFIEKIVPTLSEEMKTKRAEMVAERNAEMREAAEAQAQRAAANARGGRRGRNTRGRGNRGTARGRTAQGAAAQGGAAQGRLPQGGLRQTQREGESQRGQSQLSQTHPNEPGQSNAAQRGNQTVIELSSESDSDSGSNFSDSSSVSGDEGVYYGGYGRCFTCGRRGHWANGCPDAW